MEADQLQQLQQQQQQQQQQSNANLQSDPKPSNSSFSSDNNNSNANVKSNDNSNANTNVNNNMPPVVSTAIATTAVNSPPKRPNMDVITSTSSPIAYRSTRSLNANPPPPSFDQVSLPSIESDTALLQHHRQQQQQRSGSQRGGGDQSLLLGFQMFEQQQKEWDRKKQQQTIIRKSNSGGNRGRTTEGEGGGKVYINNTTTTTTNNHNNREPQDQQHYQHQQHYQQHYQNTYYNNMGDVPTTVHFRSSDGDDVSESLKDETTIGVMTTISAASGPTSSGRDRTSGGGSNNKSNHHPNHNQVMKRVNSLGKFLKSPLVSKRCIHCILVHIGGGGSGCVGSFYRQLSSLILYLFLSICRKRHKTSNAIFQIVSILTQLRKMTTIIIAIALAIITIIMNHRRLLLAPAQP
jgi:hypothetical protein